MRTPQPSHSILGAEPRRSSCRLCGKGLRLAVDFGRMPLANAFLTREQFASEVFFNLSAGFCEPCSLFQLLEQPKPEQMFHGGYPFFTGSSEGMRRHFSELASRIRKDFLPDGGFITDLGSNDGTFLKNFPQEQYKRLGIEPSANVASAAQAQGIETEISFFDIKISKRIRQQKGGADVFAGTNVLCHIPDLAGTLHAVAHLLNPEGVAIFEDPYLGEVLAKTSYDQIYDEHVYLFSVTALVRACESQGLRLFDAELIWTHGGSLRYSICKKDSKRMESPRVRQFLDSEKKSGMLDFSRYEQFREQCEHSRDLLIETLTALKAQRKRVAGYAATSKSTTVLNYCGITPDLVTFISDTTPEKQGKFTPGTHIPVLPYEHFKSNYPTHALLFAWNHTEEIYAKEEAFVQSGGRWITYVPKVKVS